ncbi:MAG TPA: hypothetical protein VH298_17540, partial [Jatrophihabitans sp.]|nr:hypothetical protein [Jatrophihabitans sp.]
RRGEPIEVLVESIQDGTVIGRAAHQAPETDGAVSLTGELAGLRVGRFVRAVVTDNEGADLIAEPIPGSIR